MKALQMKPHSKKTEHEEKSDYLNAITITSLKIYNV